MESGLEKSFIATGTKSNLAKRLGLRPQTVIQWKVIPWWWLERVALATGLSILTLHPVLRMAASILTAEVLVAERKRVRLNLPQEVGENKE